MPDDASVQFEGVDLWERAGRGRSSTGASLSCERPVCNSETQCQRTRAALEAAALAQPFVLMKQESRGAPTYWRRRRICLPSVGSAVRRAPVRRRRGSNLADLTL